MNFKKATVANSVLNSIDLINSLSKDGKYDEALKRIDELLNSPALAEVKEETSSIIGLTYSKAIIYDMMGRAEDSVEVLIELVNAHPGANHFSRSLEIVCSNLGRKAEDAILKDESSPLVGLAHGLLSEYGTPGYRLIYALALQEAAAGNVFSAWDRIKHLLELSPNDSDYLACAIEVAKRANMHSKRLELINYAKSLLESKPYRLELAPVIKKALDELESEVIKG